MNAISVTDLKKTFQSREVLKGVSFSVARGTVYALLGANGAGKTTTIRILTTLLAPDGGTAEILGHDVVRDAPKVREAISLTGQFSAVDEGLTGRENLILMGKLRRERAPKEAADRLLSYFGLSSHAKRRVFSYSGGMKRKLDIAMSLLGTPGVLFLDEPTTGLDPQSRRAMWELIRGLKSRGVTIFLTTQYLEEAEWLADRIAILNQGVILTEGRPEELKARLPQGAVEFLFSDAKSFETARALLSDHESSASPEERKLVVFTDGKANTLAEIFCRLRENGADIRDFTKRVPNLEDVFLAIIEESEEKKCL